MPENEKCFCHLNGLAVKDATARAQIEALRNQTVEELNQQIEALNQQIAALNGSLELLNDLNSDIAQLNQDVADLNTITENYPSVSEKASSAYDSAVAAMNKATAAETKNGTQDAAISELQKSINYNSLNLGYIENRDGRFRHWNPPSRAGYEYETMELWDGKIVYTKLVNCGKMPSNSEKWVDHGCAATAVLRAFGQCGNTCFPRVEGTSFIEASIYLNTTSIGIYYGGNDRTDEDALVQIWYVKN